MSSIQSAWSIRVLKLNLFQISISRANLSIFSSLKESHETCVTRDIWYSKYTNREIFENLVRSFSILHLWHHQKILPFKGFYIIIPLPLKISVLQSNRIVFYHGACNCEIIYNTHNNGFSGNFILCVGF